VTESLLQFRSTAEEKELVSVLLCGKLEAAGRGLDVEKVRRLLDALEGVRSRIIPDLCHAPDEIRWATANGTRRAVVGVCSSNYAERELHFHARKAGLDPLGIEVVNLGASRALIGDGFAATEAAFLLLVGSIASAQAYQGSTIESLKPYFPSLSQGTRRRSLFTVPPVQYRAVASIDRQQCAAEAGCNLCVRACPAGALARRGDLIAVDKAQCDGCGLCLAACGRGAIDLPGRSLVQLEARITALLEASDATMRPCRILFQCGPGKGAADGAASEWAGHSPEWLPIEVKCAGILSTGLILQSVGRGAEVAVDLACDDSCRYGQAEPVRKRIDYCRQLLERLGVSPDRVKLFAGEGSMDRRQAFVDAVPTDYRDAGRCQAAPAPMHGYRGAADAILALAFKASPSADLVLHHAGSPLGKVTIAPADCTACGACTLACPTEALALVRNGDEVAFTFDHGVCVGCGECIQVCPEQMNAAISLEKVTDLGQLAAGPAVLFTDTERRCVSCSAPIATISMLNHIAEMLGSDYAGMSARLERYCPACR
jgi:ferredoxin